MSFPLLLKIVSVPDELPQSDLIGDLRSQRDELAARLAAVSAKLSRLNAAEAGQREAQNGLDALAAAELAEMQPRPDMERRSELNHQLATAISLSETLRQAAANLHAEHSEISAHWRLVNERLEAAAIDRITEMFADQLAELTRAAETIREKQARVFGAVVFIRETAEGLMSGRTDKATLLFRRLEALAALPQPEFHPSIGMTNAAAPAWAKLFREMVQ